MVHFLRQVVHHPEITALAGLATLAALFALAALISPRRRWLRIAGAFSLVAAVVGLLGVGVAARASIVDEFFSREGATLVRASFGDQIAQRLAGPLDRELLALLVASLASLVVLPLWTAASLRAWGRGRRKGWLALVVIPAALPLAACGCVGLLYILSCLRDAFSCGGMGPWDPTPDIVERWANVDALRSAVLAVGLGSATVGAFLAHRAARADHIAGNRGLLAALAVFVVGGVAFLATRAHAIDTAEGPRRAFLGAPYEPFGAIARPWSYSDFIDPPTASACFLRHYGDAEGDFLDALTMTADGELIVSFDDLGEELRGTAAWERQLKDALALRERFAWREVPLPRAIEAAIDRDAPLARVLPYLAVAAAHGADEVLVVSRRPLIASTRILGDVRIDKVCAVATLRLIPGAPSPEGIPTWGELARRAALGAPAPIAVGVPEVPRPDRDMNFETGL